MSLLRLAYVSCFLLLAVVCSAQRPAVTTDLQLLDRLAGNWVLQGTIAGKQTTFDVHADWVLNREYLRMHEISREKNSNGNPAYEAIVFISWDAKAQEYVCLWLDSTEGGGLSAQGLGHGKRSGSSIPFLFTVNPSDLVRNTFTYDDSTDTWVWLIDNIINGKVSRFANVKLSKNR